MSMGLKEKNRYIIAFLKNVPPFLNYKLFKKKRNLSSFCGVNNINEATTSLALKKAISSSISFAAIRFGAVELSCLNNHEKIELGFKKKYKDSVIYSMKNNAGFFPCDQSSLAKYGDILLPKLKEADFLGISGVHLEDYFYKKYMPSSKVILYEGMEPLHEDWIKSLEGKKVLVISSFAEDIESQYKIKDKLFPEGVIPSFELKTIKTPLTFAKEEPSESSFFEVLEKLYSQIDKTDFDIALIGAGAYGTFLALHCKEIGKQAIQTGGATMTMFGIIGKRWENRSHVSRYINSYWIRSSLKPKGYKDIENGAYW